MTTADYASHVSTPTITFPSATTLFTDNATAGIVSISAPTGGVAQFKGLTLTAVELLYVEVRCIGLQPMFATTAWQKLSTESGNGLMVTCMTGISNCTWTLTDVAMSAGATTACMNDPRYLTWRMMNIKYLYIGTLSWWRVDSYWDVNSNVLASSWGPPIQLSANYISSTDNNGSTDLGKTYVFALADGTGVQLNHLTFSGVPPSTYFSAGIGTNALVTAPSKFYNDGLS